MKSDTYYGKGGNHVEESECLAKSVLVNNREYYFIWVWRGDIFDPYGSDILRRSQTIAAKFTKVPKEVFEHYIKYLKTKNKAFYNFCRRSYLG
jgi:hypothetical protein